MQSRANRRAVPAGQAPPGAEVGRSSSDDRDGGTEGRDHGSTRAPGPVARGRRADHGRTRTGHRAARGDGGGPLADRGALQWDHDARRPGRAGGLHHARVQRAAVPGADGDAGRRGVLPPPARPDRAAAGRRPAVLCGGIGPGTVPAAAGQLLLPANSSSGQARGQRAPGRQANRWRVHRRGRGDPGLVRPAGRHRDRQRAADAR